MKRSILGCAFGCAACGDFVVTSGKSGVGNGFREFMMIGSSMKFNQCRALGGLIIRDSGSPMVACDPNVIRAPVPADGFDNPAANAAALTSYI